MTPTFEELRSRLPRDERSDRASLLLVMYLLQAVDRSRAKETASISKELVLRLGSKAPKNPSLLLRRASPLIGSDPVEGSKNRLLWWLTESGMNYLSDKLGLKEAEAAPVADKRVDVAIVCALRSPELDSVVDAFGGDSNWKDATLPDHQHIYRSTVFKTNAGAELELIAGAPTYMGLTATAILATQMIMLFRPRLLVMVGIAAGTKSDKRGFGDILIADPSVDYASGKVVFKKGNETFQPDPYPLPIAPALRTLLQEEQANKARLAELSESWKHKRPDTPLRLHIGAVGAGDQVVDSKKRVELIKLNWRKLIGIEMETYALYRAAHEAPSPRPMWLSLKSVCDFAASKNDEWQDYAAFTSASFFRNFLAAHWGRLSKHF